jgi:hypothetical protein
MLRRSHITTATALLAVAAAPASAATYEQLHGTAPPPSSASAEQLEQARGAALDLPRVHYPTPKVATEPPAPLVTVTESPSGGFDWGDAGIGAAGMLALFGLAGGSVLLLTARKRRRDVRLAIH